MGTILMHKEHGGQLAPYSRSPKSTTSVISGASFFDTGFWYKTEYVLFYVSKNLEP